MMTSTYYMQNYERQRYRSGFDQRSMCYQRETSPMSLRSFPDRGRQNFHTSYYPRGMSSQKSVFNGRSGSPVSVRSIDSNASVIAVDIALAFKNVNFNKYDLRIIKEAYIKFMKKRARKRMEKRRNLNLFLKGTRKDTGYDSGEQGSDSSISSDDCRSTRTAVYKENLPISRPKPRPRSRLSRTDMTQLKNTIQESDMYQNCTENFQQNSLRNMLVDKNTQANVSPVTNKIIDKPQNDSLVSLKDRFAKGNSFVLPSQRFTRPGNKINDEISRSQSNAMQTRQAMHNFKETASNKSVESNSENEEIFSEVTVRENVQESTLLQRTRSFDLVEANYSDIKRQKLTSPIKHTNESLISSTLINTQNKNFTFKMPQMPVRKSTKGKNTIFNDKLIAQSAPPIVDDFDTDFTLHSNEQAKKRDSTTLHHNSIQTAPTNKETINNETEISQNITDVSMKSSFIKRKLFSQKLDLLDKKNQSIENVVLNSPQTKLYSGEKHKVRKLASSQSCLNLEVLENDNVLDLINKIVPSDKINITNVQNKKETRKSQDEDKWDVTSVISMCNSDDVSDTYTDEEIFKTSQSTNNKVNNKTNKVINITTETNESKKVTKQKIDEIPKTKNTTKKIKLPQCKVMLNKLSPKECNNYVQDKPVPSQIKRTVSSCVKSFWDTDFESDIEEQPHFTWNSKIATSKYHENIPVVNNTINLPKKNGFKGAILTVRSTQNKGVNSSSRSDRSKVSQRTNQKDNQVVKEQNKYESKKSNCKTNLNTSVTEGKNKRRTPKSKDIKKSSAQEFMSKSKETCNNQKKCGAVKNIETNEMRIQPSRKVNESKRQSSPKSNQSSFNCSNIFSRSLKERSKSKETCNKQKKCGAVKNIETNEMRIQPSRKVNESKRQSSPKSNQSSFNCSNIFSRNLKERSKSKETCNKQKKCGAVKNIETNEMRIQPSRKVNESKRQSSPKSNQSSFNCSNIFSRSLKERSKSKETCNKQKKCGAVKNIETNEMRIQPSRKVNESKRQSSPKSNQSSFNCSNIFSRNLKERSKSKETCNKQKKCGAVKNIETNEMRIQPSRKVNESKRQSSPKSNQSSFNCSNIFSRSLKERSKSKETCNKQKKCGAVKNIETNEIRIQPSRKVNESKRQSSPKSNQSSFNCSNISSRSLRVRKKQ